MTGSISGLAYKIFVNEFDSDTGNATSGAISGWLTENLGALNTYLNTSFSGDGESVSGLGLEEQNIYKEMYLYHFYTKRARNTLRGISDDSTGHIVSVRDGEQTISFVNKNEVSKVYRGLAKDSQEKLDKLIYNYNIYRTAPVQVGGLETRLPQSGEMY